MDSSSETKTDMRSVIQDAIEHLEHVLPGQAPIQDFVHHNTLHGFQHLPFPEALEAARKLTGNEGYQDVHQFRNYLRSGRINEQDLLAVLAEDPTLASDEVIINDAEYSISRHDVYLAALCHDITALSNSQFNWEIEEHDILRRFHSTVEATSRKRMLTAAAEQGLHSEEAIINDLWAACVEALKLGEYLLHPEELHNLSRDQADSMLIQMQGDDDQLAGASILQRYTHKQADHFLYQLFAQVGVDFTVRGLLLRLTGRDLFDTIQPQLVRLFASCLDQGFSAWPGMRAENALLVRWKQLVQHDQHFRITGMSDSIDDIVSLPDDPLDVIMHELRLLSIPRQHWADYLKVLALELPGWSGMIHWRHRHPGYAESAPINMQDYLAIRMVLERTHARALCSEIWQIDASLDLLRWYFRHNRAEFLVRYLSQSTTLPEHLLSLVERLLNRSDLEKHNEINWQHLANQIWTWRMSPASDRSVGYSVNRHAWRLFLVAQHLGLCGATLRTLTKQQVETLFTCLDKMQDRHSGYLWLQAYERHYHATLFQALLQNHQRGVWYTPTESQAQIVFCMDDREEGFRRHLEAINPDIITFGAAGFFGVAINWRGLDDTRSAALCPIVVTPAHDVHEVPREGEQPRAQQHNKRRRLRLWWKELLLLQTRRFLFANIVVITLAAPFALLSLLAKTWLPRQWGQQLQNRRNQFDLSVATDVTINTKVKPATPATPAQPQLGFTDEEQATRVAGLLHTIGLLDNFAPFVILMGHGSISVNNPHLAAYDCGACSGRHGGPNARVFAAMANRAEVRSLLRERGIHIPDATCFIGAEHNTGNEDIVFYDLDCLTSHQQTALQKLHDDLQRACAGSAHERARRLASAPHDDNQRRALLHMRERAQDFAQARPELGHATNAAAFIGRRKMSQGVFFDRRVFLISYDPETDPQGTVLENILLAAGPVGAGINLEYYFSTVNNDRYGCGSKVTHNVTGLFGVMEGTSSDLRTGLPKQMIEIHEAMRLQIIVEHKKSIVEQIYQRQPVLQELIGNGWVLLSVKDPDAPIIHIFKPQQGFVAWTDAGDTLPAIDNSVEWYRGHDGPLPPALLTKPGAHHA